MCTVLQPIANLQSSVTSQSSEIATADANKIPKRTYKLLGGKNIDLVTQFSVLLLHCRGLLLNVLGYDLFTLNP